MEQEKNLKSENQSLFYLIKDPTKYWKEFYNKWFMSAIYEKLFQISKKIQSNSKEILSTTTTNM